MGRPRRDRTGDPLAPPAVTDEQLAAILNDEVGRWRMPDPTPAEDADEMHVWQERVQRRSRAGSPRAGDEPHRGFASALARLPGSVLQLAALTLVVAVAGLWISAGVRSHGGPPATTHGPVVAVAPASSSPSPAGPAASGRDGRTRLLAITSDGYSLLDTGRPSSVVLTGRLSPPLVWASPDGGVRCLCIEVVAGTGGAPGRTAVELRTFDASLAATGTRTIVTYPAPALATAVLVPADERYALVAWTMESAGGWQSGIDLLDLDAGTVLQSVPIPSRPTSRDGLAGSPPPPSLVVAPDGSYVVVSQVGATQTGLAVAFRGVAAISNDALGPLRSLGDGISNDATCVVMPLAGASGEGQIDLLCKGGHIVQRYTPSGKPLETAVVDGLPDTGLGWSRTVADPWSGLVYVWDATGRALFQIDVRQARMAGVAKLPGDVGAYGQRVSIPPSLILSAGGGAAFLLMPSAPAGAAQSSLAKVFASDGVWVLDTATMRWTGHLLPKESLASIAVSPDGLVLVAGRSGREGAPATGLVTVRLDATGSGQPSGPDEPIVILQVLPGAGGP